MPARAFTTYRSAGPVLPEFLSNLKNLFKVAYIYPYDVSAARTQNSKDFFTVKVILFTNNLAKLFDSVASKI